VRNVALLLSAAMGLAAACRNSEPAPSARAGEASSRPELLRAGAALPDLRARTHTGDEIRFADLKGKPVVVYFYPKDDTPGCTIEAQEIRDLYGEIQGTGAVVLGVSTDGMASHKAFAEKYQLPFVLLVDEDRRIAEAFGVPLKSGRASRVSFVFGSDGRVARVFANVKPKGHGAELLAALRSTS